MHQGVETPPVNHVSNPAMPEWHYHGYIDLYELPLFFNFFPRSALGWPALPSNWFSVMFKFVYPADTHWKSIESWYWLKGRWRGFQWDSIGPSC